MSDARRVLLVGATGLIGRAVMEQAAARSSPRIVALTRREAPMPRGARMEMLVAPPESWPEAVARIGADAVICALGTTMRKAGSEEAFRAVDHDLVLAVARAAREIGTANFVLVSSAGADPHAKPFYLRLKGEVESAVTRLRLRRLDILRPGLLRGSRPEETRPLERLGILLSPLTDRFLFGQRAGFRSVDARTVAAGAIHFAHERAQGRFVHDNASIVRAARRLQAPA